MSVTEIKLSPATVFKVHLGDKVYEMRKPKAREVAEYQSRLSKIKDDDVKILEAVMSFMVDMGLPKAVCEDLEFSQLEALLEAIIVKKK